MSATTADSAPVSDGSSETPRSEGASVAAFLLGVDAGQHPQRRPANTGLTVVGGSSPWLGTRCRYCNHTFRRGDAVQVGRGPGEVRHADPALRCTPPDEHDASVGDPACTAARGGAVEDFVAGLLTTWRTANDVRVFTLAEGDLQVTMPGSGPTSMECPGCGHTFRAGDRVIVCPCAEGDNDPRRNFCKVTVHRDPARGLNCWDDWCPTGRLPRCPRTVEAV